MNCSCMVVCLQCETVPISLPRMVQHVTTLHGGRDMTEEAAAELTAKLAAPIHYCAMALAFGGSHEPSRRRWEDYAQGDFDGYSD